jgi:S-adenosylmethionine synthetase
LCRLFRERFGVILDVDKVLLWGGEAQPSFGGRVVQPIEIFIAGRRRIW